MLKNQPMLGAEYQVRGGETVRRTLLKKSVQHVYYSVDEANASSTRVLNTGGVQAPRARAL